MKKDIIFEDYKLDREKTLEQNRDDEHKVFFDNLHKAADYLSQRSYGFVSKYKGDFYLIKEGGNVKHTSWNGRGVEYIARVPKMNDKVEQINSEYQVADEAAGLIGAYVEFLSMYNLKKSDCEMRKGCKEQIRRIMDACIKKGFQFPAIKTIYHMGFMGIDATNKEVVDYLGKITRNYAKKHAYNDFNAKYVKEEEDAREGKYQESKTAETNVNWFFDLINDGYLGEEFELDETVSQTDVVEGLRELYKTTYQNSKANLRVAQHEMFDSLFGFKEDSNGETAI